jgi:acyl dehydratase
LATIKGTSGLKELAGHHLGYTEWREVTQEQVNQFADATDDHQWIHVDLERASNGPFGGTIAHGYLTMSMAAAFAFELMTVEDTSMGINYGLNRVRFPSPVPVGSKLRAGALLQSVEDIAGGVQATIEMTFEVESGSKPACVAEILFRYYD